MEKQTLLIIIDTLKKGGAEVLLAGILPELNAKYGVILVTLSGESDFNESEIICRKKYTLGCKGKLSFIACIFRLRKIIKRERPAIIHSHLIYSTLLARLACPRKIPLLFSIHNELSKNVFDESPLLTFLEKMTLTKKQWAIAVSGTVLKDYVQTIGTPGKTFILKNYISDDFFISAPRIKKPEPAKKIKLVALGNIKNSKNYEYVLRSLIFLNAPEVSLDIYGNTNSRLFSLLEALIEKHNIQARFMGPTANVREIFSDYDLFVMSSSHEGFGIAAIEAMACGLPLLLSDLPVLREVTSNNALFFNLSDPMALARLTRDIMEGKYDLDELSSKGFEIAKQYTKQKYLEELFHIYQEVRENP
jgi:glycosyltransferase involved in cell wall biosynthesis